MVKNEKSTVDIVEGRNVVKSLAWGEFSAEDVKALIDGLLISSKKLKPGKWGYIADPTKLDPILSKEASDAFVNLHVVLEKNGCAGIAFLDGKTAAMKQKTKRHSDSAGGKMVTDHFRDEKDALDWLTNIGVQ